MTQKPHDNEKLRAMVLEIDDDAEDLKGWDLKFIVDLVDRGQAEFTPKQAAQIERIYKEQL